MAQPKKDDGLLYKLWRGIKERRPRFLTSPFLCAKTLHTVISQHIIDEKTTLNGFAVCVWAR